ncbi:MAG TPA: hypothetical protein DIC42_03775 [Holosporales bacterium]|nr:hypothetical protein [Holosporales bacterium]
MRKPIYLLSIFCSIITLTSTLFSAPYRDDGWGRSRYEDAYTRDLRQQDIRAREKQERLRKEQEVRRKKYRSIFELTSIFDAVSRKISNDALINVFKQMQLIFGDDVIYQVIDSLSQPDIRSTLLDAFFDEDTASDHIAIKLDDNFYARFLASISFSKAVSQSTVQAFSSILEQKLFDRWDNISRLKAQIIDQKMGYIPAQQLTPLVNIMNKAAKNTEISKEFMASAFENMKETFDYAFAHQLVNTLVDKNMRSQILTENFGEGNPKDKTAVVINPQFYATLIDALYEDEDIEPADTDVFVQIAEGILSKEWKRIDSLRTQEVSKFKDAWGAVDNTEQMQTLELDGILRQRNVNTDKIKAQFIIDFMTTYMETKTTATVSAFGNFNTVQDTRLDRLKTAFKTVKTTYINKLSDKRYARNIANAGFVKDFSTLIDKVEKMTMQIDGPRYTPWLFQTYLSKLTNQNFRAQVQNGARIDIKKAFADFAQSQTNGKPAQMNSDMLYLLCIQLIGILETEVLNGDSITKVQDFIKNTQELLQVTLPSKLNNSPVVMGVLQTILQTIPAQVQKPDVNILFGVGIFNMIKLFGLNGPMQQILVQRIQPTLGKMGISNQTVAQYQTLVVQHLQQLKIITASSTQKLDLFNQKQSGSANQQDQSQSILEKTLGAVDSVSKTSIGKNFFNKLFG